MLDTVSNYVDSVLDGIDTTVRKTSELLLGPNPRALFDIEAAISDTVFQVRGGGRLTVVEILGANSVSGSDEFIARIDHLFSTLKPRLRKHGHLVKVIFESSPADVKSALNINFGSEFEQARRMGLDVHDLIREKISVNTPLLQVERCWLGFYTTAAAVDKSMTKSDADRVSGKLRSAPPAGNSQPTYGLYTRELNSIHRETIEAITSGLRAAKETGLALRILRTDEVLFEIQKSIYGPDAVGGMEFDQLVVSDEERERRRIRRSNTLVKAIREATQDSMVRAITPRNRSTLEAFLPLPLADQIMHTPPLELQTRYVVAGTRAHVPLMVTKHTDSPLDFDRLIRIMKGIPFRITFTITPDGLSGDVINKSLAGYFSFLPGNGDTTKARALLQRNRENDPDIGLSIAFSTWCDLSVSVVDGKESIDLAPIRDLQNRLSARIQDWGGVAIDNSFGDVTEGLLSTLPGLIGRHVAAPTPAPLSDVVAMLPISRIACPWQRGSTLYRTVDGKPYYYEQYSDQQAAWISAVTGPMGYGKSGEMFSRNFWYLVQGAETADLPLLRGIDFSYSQSGLVDIVKSSLPDDKQHLAKYIRPQNHVDYGWNPWTTLLGCRQPLATGRGFLSNLLLAATSSLAGSEAHQGIVNSVISRAYERYSDAEHNPDAKSYAPGLDERIDRRLEELGIVPPEHCTWWYLVDELFNAGDTRHASMAQDWALPNMGDIPSIATSSEVRSEYPEFRNGVAIVELFARAIRESIEALPFISGRTRLDISESPIVIFDLASMVGDGKASKAQANQNAIVLMSFLRMLCSDFWLDQDDVPYIEGAYQAHHAAIIRRNSTLKKRLFGDEKHRTNGSDAFNNELDRMTVEARKFKVDLMFGSHVPGDFPPKMLKFCTNITMCGAGSEDAIEEIGAKYGLNATQKGILKGISPPTKEGARVLQFLDTKYYGRQVAELVNTDGPKMLWAKATYAEDREVRSGLYQALGDQRKARSVLAKMYPSGSCLADINRRKELMGQKLYESPTGNLFRDILQELIVLSRQMEQQLEIEGK